MPEDTRKRPAVGPSQTNSEELFRRVQVGESAALDRLFSRYLPRLQRWARRRVPAWSRNAVDTDDLVQDTMLHTFQRARGFQPRRNGALLGYLRRSLLNRIRDQFRVAGRRPVPVSFEDQPGHDPRDPADSPLDIAIAEDDRERYFRALKRLRIEDRQAIIARIELGYTYEQLALALSKPGPEAARIAVRRALLRLAEEMTRG